VSGVLTALNRLEEPSVRWVVTASRRPGLAACCRWVNRLGNGWLYLFAVVAALSTERGAALRVVVTAGAAVGLAFLPYYCIKPRLARLRPCDQWPMLGSGVPPLDRFSCPSGHCMTVVAVGIPFAWNHSPIIPLIVAIAAVMAWARIALGHHYPSDILLGAGIGLAMGAWVSAVCL